jgi:hypothetical protein
MNGRLLRRDELPQDERTAMFTLLSAHFHGVDRTTFDRDLDEKNWVVVFDDGDRLRGFTTLLAYETVHDGEPISVVYSGDTIMARDGWKTATLPRAWITAVRALRERYLRGNRLYWLLLTAGFRTYRLLPVFWREFYPRCDRATPTDVQALLNGLASERLGAYYCRDTGIVRFATPHVLRDDLREVGPGRLTERHVAFFLERNPGWCRGDELACLTEVSFENLTPAGRRMWNSEQRHESRCLERMT